MKAILILIAGLLGAGSASEAKDLPVERAILTSPPEVPPAIKRDYPAKVQVEIEVIEKVGKLADGVEYTFWTFGGSVPGKFIRVREGDTVEFTLANHPGNKLPHNIDLHAVTGPGGGASATFTVPGHKSRFTFKALNAGLFIYHCATAPVGMHIANGMYGMIYVQPEKRLPDVDREFYVVQGDFYTDKPFGVKGHQPFSMKRAIDENPSYVLFNGSAASMTGDSALKAKKGETIRLFVGNGGPNLVSSFHVIGEIFDRVYFEGGVKAQENVQTTLIPAGGSAIIEFKLDTTGTYILVDHSIFRTFNKGSLGMLKVEGDEDKLVFSGKEMDDVYFGDESVASNINAGQGKVAEGVKAPTLKKISAPKGSELFAKNCSMCHQDKGQGLEGVFPPLAGSDFLMNLARKKDRKDLISLVDNGKTGKIIVNGKEYNGVMTPVAGLNDEEVAAVLNFVTSSWGNSAPAFTAKEVNEARKQNAKGVKAGAAH